MLNSLALGILIFLSGCMLGPDYQAPCLEIPDTFIYETPDAQGNLNIEWWQQFDDEVMTGLIEEALAYNKNVKIAAANIDYAVGILIQTRAPLLPQIGYNASYTRTRISQTLATTEFPGQLGFPNPQTTWQAVLAGSWEIDIWGRIRREIESARANVFATYQARQQVILSLVASVADSYIQLRSLDEQLVISQKTMNSYWESVVYFETQFKYGQTSRMTVVQARTQYEIAASKIPQLQSLIVQTENAICILLGSNPRSIPRGKNIYQLKKPAVPPDLPSELLNQRPDIMEAEERLIAANAQIGAAKALYFPAISLTGVYGGASQHLKKLFAGPSNIWTFVGSITGPIFTAGSIYGQVFQAEAQQQAALIGYKETVQNAFADVENALVEHTMLISQLEAQTRLVAAAGEYVYLATLQYKGGYSPYFVVIQAQEQYFPAQLSWVQTQADLLGALVATYQAMGGGWVVTAENMTHPEKISDVNGEPFFIPIHKGITGT